jgi:MOSC domain-containing protein YiiM
VNRTSTVKVIGNTKFHVKVVFEGHNSKTNETGVIIIVVTDGGVHADDIVQVLREEDNCF